MKTLNSCRAGIPVFFTVVRDGITLVGVCVVLCKVNDVFQQQLSCKKTRAPRCRVVCNGQQHGGALRGVGWKCHGENGVSWRLGEAQ